MDSSRWKPSKATKDANINRQGFSLRILGFVRHFCSITLRKEEPSIANIISHYWCVLRKKSPPPPKKNTNEEEKVLFHQDNAPCHKSIATMAKLHEMHFELLRTHPILQIWPQWLVAVCRPQKNAPGKEIWHQWRDDIGSWRVFGAQRQIVLQKSYRIVREALESVYHPRRRLRWWIKSKFAYKLFY